MAAALIRARLAEVGPDLKPQIDVWTDWVANQQFRFPDGTLARPRPQAESLWADDAYMSIPALAEMGRLTGDRKWFDDAVKQASQLSKHPTSEYAQHGYGPVLLAVAEVIRLLENPNFEIQYRLRTYHFVPKDGRPTSYREHQ